MGFLTEALSIDLNKHRLIAAVGAGGKTTLIYELARELRGMGYSAAVTTTTHMEAEGRYGFTPIGEPCGDGKIRGCSRLAPYKLLEKFDFVLAEADGSRRLPFKVPEEHEPVLPENVQLVIGMAGASAVGEIFAEKCCRHHLACRHFSCGPDERIEIHHLVESLTSVWGQKKNVTCDYRYVIGQGDLLDKSQREYAGNIAGGKEEGCILSVSGRQCWPLTSKKLRHYSVQKEAYKLYF